MSRGDASALLQQALEGHYTGWQARQQEKMERFITESLQRGLSNLHDPMMWGQNSVKFLTSDDMPPKWMSEKEAIDMLYQIAEAVLERNEVTRYHLDHGHRDFAGGKSFTFFRLCNDAEASLQNWITEQTIKTIEYVADAVNAMVKGASQGDADVWAKVPSGKYPNYLVKDEPIPVGLTREQAVQEIYKVVMEVLDKEFDLPGVRVETMGSIMSGTWFKLTYHIPRPQPSHLTPSRSRGEKLDATRTPPSTGRGYSNYAPSSARKTVARKGPRGPPSLGGRVLMNAGAPVHQTMPGAGPPGPQGVCEEAACLRTIVQCLTLSLASYRGEEHSSEEQQLSLPDTREFLCLIVNLLESNPAAERLRELALEDENTPIHILLSYATADSSAISPSYANADTFNHAGYAGVRVQCLQTITKIVTMTCAASGGAAAEEGSSVNASHLRDSPPGAVRRDLGKAVYGILTSTGAVDILLRFVADTHEVESVRTASAECLFVFISKLAAARQAVVQLRVVPFFFNLLWTEQSKMVRNYLCATIKVVGEHYPEQLLDASVVEKSIALLQTEPSKHVAIMLLDILTIMVTGYHQFYTSRVHSDAATLQGLCRLCEAVLKKNTREDVVIAVTRLMEAVFGVEGLDRQHTTFTSYTLTTNCWRALIPAPPADGVPWDESTTRAAVIKTGCLRVLVQNCCTQALVEALGAAFMNHFPAISFLLNAPLDEGHPPALKREVALAVALWLAKSAAARGFIRSTLEPYATWAAALKGRLHELLMEVDIAVFEEVYIVDCHAAYLNNPAEPYIDYSDMASIYKAVKELFRTQEGQALGTVHDVPVLSDASRARGFETTDGRVRIKAGQRKQRLTLAILNYVVEVTFGKGGATASEAGAGAAETPMAEPPRQQAEALINQMQTMFGTGRKKDGTASPPPGSYSAYESMRLPPSVTSPNSRAALPPQTVPASPQTQQDAEYPASQPHFQPPPPRRHDAAGGAPSQHPSLRRDGEGVWADATGGHSPMGHQPAPPVDLLELPAYSSTATSASCASSASGALWKGNQGGIPAPPGPSWKTSSIQRHQTPTRAASSSRGDGARNDFDSPPEPLYKVAQRRIDELQRKQQRMQVAIAEEEGAPPHDSRGSGATQPQRQPPLMQGPPMHGPIAHAHAECPSGMSLTSWAEHVGDFLEQPHHHHNHQDQHQHQTDHRYRHQQHQQQQQQHYAAARVTHDHSLHLDDLAADTGGQGSLRRAMVPHNSIANSVATPPTGTPHRVHFSQPAPQGAAGFDPDDTWPPTLPGHGPYVPTSPRQQQLPPQSVLKRPASPQIERRPPAPMPHTAVLTDTLQNRPAWPPWPPPGGTAGPQAAYVVPKPPSHTLLRGDDAYGAGQSRGGGVGKKRSKPPQQRWR